MAKPEDEGYMRLALELAERARGMTSPNPMVGAVVVRDGEIVGKGYHPKAGLPHAESYALDEAGERSRGATLYVALEPCCHWGRTPPCTVRLIKAGVARVVAAMIDPDRRVSGKGVVELKNAGLEVEVGILEREAKKLNEAYVHWHKTGLPFIILKIASTLDGKIATAAGESKWLTSEESRSLVHSLRSQVDAVLVGIGTVLADDPKLTARISRGEESRTPKRVILDTNARLPLSANLVEDGQAETIAVVSDLAPGSRIEALRRSGLEVIVIPAGQDGRVDLGEALKELGRREILSLLVEGGAKINSSFLKADRYNKIYWFLSPAIMGGDGLSAVDAVGTRRLKELKRLVIEDVKRVGPDILVESYPAA